MYLGLKGHDAYNLLSYGSEKTTKYMNMRNKGNIAKSGNLRKGSQEQYSLGSYM